MKFDISIFAESKIVVFHQPFREILGGFPISSVIVRATTGRWWEAGRSRHMTP